MPALSHLLVKANQSWEADRIGQASRAYQQILRLLPMHALANSRVGITLFRARQYTQAIGYFNRARNAQPTSFAHWARLLVAYRRAGQLVETENLLSEIRKQGFPSQDIEVLEKLLDEPDEKRQQALIEFRDAKDWKNAEIAARLLLEDYPGHALGRKILGEIPHNSVEKQGSPIAD
jgi:tetratricopeptide (TPR) repeat protein